MSAFRKLVMNCGASHVSCGLFTSNASGQLVLEKFGVHEMDGDLSADTTWLPSAMGAFRTLVAENRLSGGATLVAPGFQLLLKPVKVPVVAADKQMQAIASVVSQNLPYAMSEMIWDKHVLSDDGVELEVLVVAIKSEQSNQICAFSTACGLRPDAVTASPLLDVNAYRLSHAGTSEDVLLINMGARSTNVLYITPGDFMLRNVAMGGNAITQAIADGMAKPFEVAERAKLTYLRENRNLEGDPVGQLILKSIQDFHRKLSNELKRTEAVFRRQRPDSSLARILLTGNASLTPGLVEALQEKFNVPVEFFDPLAGVGVGSGVSASDIENNRMRLSELVGAVANPAGASAISVNLLPESVVERQALNRKKPFYVASAAILAVAGILPVLKEQGCPSALGKNLSGIEAQIRPMKEEKARQEALIKQISEVKDLTEKIKDVVNSKYNWANFLAELQTKLQGVGDVWIEDLSIERIAARPVASTAASGIDMVGSTAAVPSENAAPPKPVRKLLLKGCVMDRQNPESEVSDAVKQKVSSLLSNLSNKSRFITEVKDISYGDTISGETGPRGILTFKVVLILSTENSL